jgi:hypothetical protein
MKYKVILPFAKGAVNKIEKQGKILLRMILFRRWAFG